MDAAHEIDDARSARDAPRVGTGRDFELAIADVFEFTGNDPTPLPTSTDQIVTAHDQGVEQVKANLQKIGDAGLGTTWSGKAGDKTLMTMPKAGLLRALLMNHTYHHRGQLSVIFDSWTFRCRRSTARAPTRIRFK